MRSTARYNNLMTLRLYNTPSRSVETFTPQDPRRVTVYTCGPTVYDYPTIGNWSAYIYWDILVRALTANHLVVERVMNITDVGHLSSDEDEGEDKLEKGARRENKTAWEVAEFYTADFLQGMEQLNLLMPTHITKATDFIDEQLALVETLHRKGYTYQIQDGIYFDTSKFSAYADFAHLDMDAQKAGARVEYNEEKRNPSDFALWKFTPKGQVRDMEWPTPISLLETTTETSVMGFPGWHLECSAMAMTLLGNTLDIHTGGIDHIRVHHTNEIAQSEAASGERFSNFWLHTNHLKSDGTKISKSLGNGYTLQDLAAHNFTPEEFRLCVLQGHYQSEGNFTFKSLEAASQRLHNWRRAAALRHQTYDSKVHPTSHDLLPSRAAIGALLETLSNNLDTPGALALIDKILAEVLTAPISHVDSAALTDLLEQIDTLIGTKLIMSTPDISDIQKQTILERTRARETKDWKRSDELRDELLAMGLLLRDMQDQTLWEYVLRSGDGE